MLVLLMLLACTRGNRPAKDRAAHGPAFEDPLAEETLAGRNSQFIKVTAATMVQNCGYREGNETERLARLCNGRGRCDFAVKDGLVPAQWDHKAESLCQPDYKVTWTWGTSAMKHDLVSVMAEQGDARLRLGCGIVEAPPADVLTPAPEPQRSVGDDPTSVRGRVVGDGGLGMAGLKVHLGDRLTLTGPDGEFVFAHVPRIHDVRIASREGFRAAVYLGLSRRDPVLAYIVGSDSGAGSRHHASVAGVLVSGTGRSLGRSWSDRVWFLAPRALGQEAGVYDVTEDGSRYSPVNIGWGGSSEVRGALLALLGSPSGEPWSGAHLAVTALSLRDGDAAGVHLRPHPIPSGHIAGRIGQATGQGEAQKLRFSYLIPGWVGDIDLDIPLSLTGFLPARARP